MVNITCYGGVNEIGGNKILVEDDETRVILDFGRRMGEAGKFYEEFIQVRSKCALLDLLKLGILPKIDGIYPEYFLNCTSLAEEEIDISSKLPMEKAKDYWQLDSPKAYNELDPEINGVFISHAHFDHIQDVSFLHHDIPVYCTATTKTLAKAITNVSKSGVEYQFYKLKDPEKMQLKLKNQHNRTVFPGELEYKSEKETILIKDIKSGYKFNMDINHITRNYITEAEGNIGKIKYKIIPVGHSVPGASSILLNTSDDKRILYTGDIRFHGRNEPALDDFISKINDEKIDILICEGTRIDSEKKLTEDDVYNDIIKQAKNTKGLLLVDFGWKDTTRFDTIAKVAQETRRTFVINPKLAYLLYELFIMDKAKYSDPTKLDYIKVYKKRQEQRLYSKQDYEKFKAGYLEHWGRNIAKADQNIVRISEKLGIGGDSSKWPESPEDLTPEEEKAWELATHHIEHGVTAYQIREAPEKYILMFSFWDANELFDLSTPDGIMTGAKYIRASCEPFNDEMEIDEKKFMNWLDKFGVEYESEMNEENNIQFKRAHVSGHASRPELKELIEKIKPKVLIPIHTNYPDKFVELVEEIGGGIEVKIPIENETYTF